MRATANQTSPLINLTRRLLGRHVAGGHDRFFAIVGPPSRPRLQPALQPDRLESLVGMRAPRSWSGVAIVADGNARNLTDPSRLDSLDSLESFDGLDAATSPFEVNTSAARSRICVAVAVDRSGRHASTLADPDGQLWWSNDEPVEGFVADVCRRVLGIACPSEPRGTIELANAQWLDLILHLAADPLTAPGIREWVDLVTLHPAVDPNADPRVFEEPDVLASTARQVAASWPWERLREAASRGLIELGDVTAEQADWMDSAFLARWLLGMHRGVDELLDDLRLFLNRELHDRVVAVVRDR